VHLHACVTDGVFVPAAAEAACDTPPAFLPARPINQADLATLTDWGELVQIHDDRDILQASPDELPTIDIHSL